MTTHSSWWAAKRPFTVYEVPQVRTLIHSSIFPDALGVFKLPGSVYIYFGVFLIVEPYDRYRLVAVSKHIFDMAETIVNTTTRAVVIAILKRAIQNTTTRTLQMPSSIKDSSFKFTRELNLDMLLHAEIYLEELMQAEATERQRRAAVSKIQRAFLDAYVTPTHPICQRRLHREFEEMLVC